MPDGRFRVFLGSKVEGEHGRVGVGTRRPQCWFLCLYQAFASHTFALSLGFLICAKRRAGASNVFQLVTLGSKAQGRGSLQDMLHKCLRLFYCEGSHSILLTKSFHC